MDSRLGTLFTAIDSHTEGEPTRVITEGVRDVPGSSMLEKQAYIQTYLDHIRKLAVLEPRGHSAMVGAILLPPANPAADIGVVYMDESGYLLMCGHGTIGICTVVLETGMLQTKEPKSHITIDTPAGLVHAAAFVDNGHVCEVAIRNVPSFLHSSDVRIYVPRFGDLLLDIAWGGNFFAILPAEAIGMPLERSSVKRLASAAKEIMDAIQEQVRVSHPDQPQITEIKHIMFTAPSDTEGAHGKNATFIYPDNLDRSPCGTGTSARMAVMYAREQLDLHQEFVHESLLGTTFTGKLLERTALPSGGTAVIPEISGRAWITGFQRFVLDPTDPFQSGFSING